jgi:hypothetical protein
MPQVVHALPPKPQALLAVPAAQVPLLRQHPDGQFAAEHPVQQAPASHA